MARGPIPPARKLSRTLFRLARPRQAQQQRKRRIESAEDVITMAFTMAPLLIHDRQVPTLAREALRAAYDTAPPRTEMLLSAARILHMETDLDCRDALELVGLSEEARCA